MVNFKSKGLNIEYRCVKSALFDKIIPKKVNDHGIGYITLDENAIDMMKKGATTMKSGHGLVMFYKSKDTDQVQFILKDDTKSEMKFDVDTDFSSLVDEEVTFANSYPVNILMAALDDADDYDIALGINGTLTIKKNKIDVIIPRRIV